LRKGGEILGKRKNGDSEKELRFEKEVK